MKYLITVLGILLSGCTSLDIEPKLPLIEVKIFEKLPTGWLEPKDDDAWNSIVVDNWGKKWDLCESEIIRKARLINLDIDSLKKCLNVVKSSSPRIALLPIAVYYGTYNGTYCWNIICRWEAAHWKDCVFSHVRHWIIDAKTGKVMEFLTCD